MNTELLSTLDELLKVGELDKAIEAGELELKKIPATKFHTIINKNLLHLTPGLIDYLDIFYRNSIHFFESKGKILKAIYSEMNGFSINYDLWFIDAFSYSFYEGPYDLGWLADYEFEGEGSYVISGFEDVQLAYEDYMKNKRWSDKTQETAAGICELIVILRLQQLFKHASNVADKVGKSWTHIPLLVTAHDYDLICNCNQL